MDVPQWAAVTPASAKLRPRNLVFYEVFVRNHSLRGDFAGVEADLPRIRAMGVDVVSLMPIFPIGRLARKGSRGSPYSVREFCQIDADYGSAEDLADLIRAAHGLGLKVILDVVLNHTALDCPLYLDHPDWYAPRSAEHNTLPEWTDVVPFDHSNPDLRSYLLSVLEHWARFGFDGFRCDAACFLPLEFWLEARRRLDALNPDLIWLAESAHIGYVAERRAAGLPILSDNELFQAFDLTYDSESLPIWQAVLAGRAPLIRYAEMLRLQDGIYPADYVKLRFVENHDQPPLVEVAPSGYAAVAWTAFQAFNKGAFLIYAGQECAVRPKTSLFETAPIQWLKYELQPFLMSLAKLKRMDAVQSGTFVVSRASDSLHAAWMSGTGGLYGIFNVCGAVGAREIPLPDGGYEDVLNGGTVRLQSGRCGAGQPAVILRYSQPLHLLPFFSDFLDYPPTVE